MIPFQQDLLTRTSTIYKILGTIFTQGSDPMKISQRHLRRIWSRQFLRYLYQDLLKSAPRCNESELTCTKWQEACARSKSASSHNNFRCSSLFSIVCNKYATSIAPATRKKNPKLRDPKFGTCHAEWSRHIATWPIDANWKMPAALQNDRFEFRAFQRGAQFHQILRLPRRWAWWAPTASLTLTYFDPCREVLCLAHAWRSYVLHLPQNGVLTIQSHAPHAPATQNNVKNT